MRKNCIVCGEEIFRGGHQSKVRTRRGQRDITCSKQCSKMYSRAYQHIRGRVRRELKTNEKSN